MMRPTLAFGVLAVLLIGSRMWLAGAGTTPDGQPPLTELATLDSLKTQFNAERQKMRAIALLSPSCPYCLKGASDTQRVLMLHPQRGITLFVVWQPILPTDWARPHSHVLRRVADTRVRQFWDGDRAVADAFRRSFEQRESVPSCCYHGDIWWDMIAVFRPGDEWRATLPEPLLLEGTVGDAAPTLEALLSK